MDRWGWAPEFWLLVAAAATMVLLVDGTLLDLDWAVRDWVSRIIINMEGEPQRPATHLYTFRTTVRLVCDHFSRKVLAKLLVSGPRK